jgi:hypothetical protein
MRLDECKIGILVQELNELPPKAKIGHIVDFVVNPSQEVIPIVKWAKGGYITPIHHYNLQVFKGESYKLGE